MIMLLNNCMMVGFRVSNWFLIYLLGYTIIGYMLYYFVKEEEEEEDYRVL